LQEKVKVLPIGVGIVTYSPPNVMSKFDCSNKSKMLSLQLTSNVVSSIAKRLAFMGKHQMQHSHNFNLMKKTKTQLSAIGAATKGSIVRSSTKPMQNETSTKQGCKRNRCKPKGVLQLSQ
jgi:hypothetical protein